MKSIIFSFIAFTQFLYGEDVTLVATSSSNGQTGYSETLTLNEGDTAKVIFAYDTGMVSFHSPSNCSVSVTVKSTSFNIPIASGSGGGTANSFTPSQIRASKPIAIAGPATIRLQSTNGNSYNGGISSIVTLSINRAGTASPPSSIPQEAGTTWDVILESSSDLVNWTTANPGEYTGTEPKRFFRTRIVKKP
jgi:hypothetical protein